MTDREKCELADRLLALLGRVYHAGHAPPWRDFLARVEEVMRREENPHARGGAQPSKPRRRPAVTDDPGLKRRSRRRGR